MINIAVKKINKKAVMPSYATAESAGMDLYALLDEEVTLLPGQRTTIPTGISLQLPCCSAAFIYARSGLGIKHGIVPSNCVGVIDSDYRGEIKVGLTNQSDIPYIIKPFERIAQMVIAPVIKANLIEAESLGDTERGKGGFGSTGRD